MFTNILALNFSDERAAVDAQSWSRHQKLFTSLTNASPCRNKMAFWSKICCFSVQKFSRMHTFQVEFYDFQQESSFFVLLIVGKEQGLFFISKTGQDAFLTPKKGRIHFLLFKKGWVHF